jgi:protein associated with RNAse G/E
MGKISVIKLDYAGQETYQYEGILLQSLAHTIIIEAFFDREEIQVEDLTLKKGDRFVEYYFDDRWYNIFEIHDQSGQKIKGWYCNICHPAEFQNGRVLYRDLALDLLVYPDGRQSVLDQNEFNTLPLQTDVKNRAQGSLSDLRGLFLKTNLPSPNDLEFYLRRVLGL